MRQWHQGKEGFMKVTRIQDKYNPDKANYKTVLRRRFRMGKGAY